MDGRPGNIPPVQRQARRTRQTREAPQRVPKAVALILGAALPDLPPAGLRGLCLRWETALAPRLAPEQMAHIRRFAPDGPALAARASRLLARLLLLRGLQSLGALRPDLCLERDMAGRPLLSGWRISFSHSGRAAFCALERGAGGPCEQDARRDAPEWHPGLGLDAEALDSPPPAARAFTDGETKKTARDALRRWAVKEAVLKALGMGLSHDPALICSGRYGGRAGLLRFRGRNLRWRVLACPGHWLCLARDAEYPVPTVSLRWLTAGQITNGRCRS